ncbi:RHS repeat-associated protein [Flavobacterium sp. 28YEA47A]|uniref:RHS repeat domain-containing protein n=1 Tax=Flavobacterium sp. 28YEA47A TaxID=3156276 RepID=UPI003512A7CE
MVLNQNKAITDIRYNHLNLPSRVFFGSEIRKIEYLYTAGGKKVRKAVSSRNLLESGLIDYLDGFQYRDGNLQFFPTSEGYVRATDISGTTAYSYVYNYTDHLGNIRLSYAKDPENPNVLKILEEDHYYPFGLKHTNYNSDLLVHREYRGALAIKDPVTPEPLVPVLPYNYKYNGKEFQDELGLNFYDYGARNYDPAIGRWMNIDPLAEQYRRWSPYNYAMNNPMRFIDPDGMGVDDVIIRGSLAEKAKSMLQSSVDNLTLNMDSQGKLSAAQTNIGPLTEADTTLQDAINSDEMTVNIETTKSNTYENALLIGGMFMGSTVENGKTNAFQLINPNQLEAIENFSGEKRGVTVLHEVLEAAIGAKDSPGAGDYKQDKAAYTSAHNKANEMDKNRRDLSYGAKVEASNVAAKTADANVILTRGDRKTEKLLYTAKNLKIKK